jgi:nitrate reductase NapAB chaperone NapD
MARFLVNSAIFRAGKDPKACAKGAVKMLNQGKIKDVELKTCYCCSQEGRVAFIVEAASRDAVLETMEKIDVPVASILEVEEVT